MVGKYVVGDTKPRRVEGDEQKGYLERTISQIVAFQRPTPDLRVPPTGMLLAALADGPDVAGEPDELSARRGSAPARKEARLHG